MSIQTIGMLGTGQLGRMMAIEAHRLGLLTVGYGPKSGPLSDVADVTVGPWDDEDALRHFAARCDVVTWELEQLPVATVDILAESRDTPPSRQALEITSDRKLEKEFVQEAGLPVVPFVVSNDNGLSPDHVQFPAILKTRTGGYDGKGQVSVESPPELDDAWNQLDRQPTVLEQQLDLHYELSVIGARTRDGETAIYDLCHNHHRDGILRWTLAPAPTGASWKRDAHQCLATLLERFDYVGVLTAELFVTDQGLYINELAPRVHNSGHWTLEGAETSQFENHVRAVAGLPLGSTRAREHSLMVNIIGEPPTLEQLAEVPGAAIHLYNKSPRPDRKLGHVTICQPEARALLEPGQRLLELVREDPTPLQRLLT